MFLGQVGELAYTVYVTPNMMTISVLEDEQKTVDNEELISTGQDGLANDEDNEPAREVQHDKGSPIPLSTPERKEKPATKVRKSESAEFLDMMRNIYQTRTTTPAVDEFQIFEELMPQK
ncbi:hypothetical protein FQR65_LT11091 [Abscondita terminalis]|nr:hypothetical protein FQR65_LT11091 [Abscondita terminalis]